MIVFSRFLDVFGGVALVAGAGWFFLLLQRGGAYAGLLPPRFDRPDLALIVAGVGLAMLMFSVVMKIFIQAIVLQNGSRHD